jgi:hypothetical protein
VDPGRCAGEPAPRDLRSAALHLHAASRHRTGSVE